MTMFASMSFKAPSSASPPPILCAHVLGRLEDAPRHHVFAHAVPVCCCRFRRPLPPAKCLFTVCLSSDVLSSSADPTLGLATVPFRPSQLRFHPSGTSDLFPLRITGTAQRCGPVVGHLHSMLRALGPVSSTIKQASKHELSGVRGREDFLSVPLALGPRPDGEEVFSQ